MENNKEIQELKALAAAYEQAGNLEKVAEVEEAIIAIAAGESPVLQDAIGLIDHMKLAEFTIGGQNGTVYMQKLHRAYAELQQALAKETDPNRKNQLNLQMKQMQAVITHIGRYVKMFGGTVPPSPF